MARKPKPKPASEPRAWSSLDDVDYDEDGEGANPMPDEDGNVVLKRNHTPKEGQRGKAKVARKRRR